MPADQSLRGATAPRVTTKAATGTRSRMDGGLLRLLGPPQPATHLPAGPNGTRNPAARGLRDGDRPQPSSLASPQGLKVRNGERSQEPNRAKYQRFIQANHRSHQGRPTQSNAHLTADAEARILRLSENPPPRRTIEKPHPPKPEKPSVRRTCSPRKTAVWMPQSTVPLERSEWSPKRQH